jgi:hypothetical protein
MYVWALARKEKALGPDHASTHSTVHNLGLLFMGMPLMACLFHGVPLMGVPLMGVPLMGVYLIYHTDVELRIKFRAKRYREVSWISR